MFHVPEKFRITKHPSLASDSSYGNNGAFKVWLSNRSIACVIASDGQGWEHISVHIQQENDTRTPTWAEMCKMKDLFWDESDCVIQFHPPKSEYVNNFKPERFEIHPTDHKYSSRLDMCVISHCDHVIMVC